MNRLSPSLLALAGSLALVAFAAGCGGAVENGSTTTGGGGAGGSTTTADIAGIYEVTHLTRGSGCIGEGDPVQGTFYYSHFRMQAESDGSYSFADCSAADPSSCAAPGADRPQPSSSGTGTLPLPSSQILA
jgi:hypothetical protein